MAALDSAGQLQTTGAARLMVAVEPTLVQRLVDGQAEAMHELYRAHHAAVRRMVRLQVGPGGVVEDLVQDTFVRAIEQVHRYRADAPLGVWLRGIALNLARTERSRARRRRGLLRDHAPALPTATDPEAQTDSRRALQSLLVLMERLPSAEREAFALRSVEKVPLQEAAEIVGCPVSTLSDRDRRAQAKLRAWIAEEGR
ncbi:MAG: sigma-70 family RNA polymerase sigma factor [Myxococcota bacterium]